MNTTKKILFTILLIFVFTISMSVAMAKVGDDNKTADTPKAIKTTTATNNTFVICMKDAVAQKQTGYDVAKETRKVCLDNAATSNTSDIKKTALKECSVDFKKSMKETKTAFNQARNECKKIKHTTWEGFKAYFQ